MSLKEGNSADTLYLTGNDEADGAIRLVLDTLDNVATFELRSNDVFNSGELKLAQGSLLLGREIFLSAAGHHLEITSPGEPGNHLIIGQPFEDTGTSPPQSTIAGVKVIRQVDQSDNSGSQTLTEHTSVLDEAEESIVDKLYLQTGATAAVDDVTVVVSHGTPPDDNISYSLNFPASDFPANSEIEIDMSPGDGFDQEDEQINVTVTSDTAFTLLYDVTETFLWFALDIQQIDHEDCLTESLLLSTELGIIFDNNLVLVRGNEVFA